MAKTKAELISEAKLLGLDLDPKLKIADIIAAIDSSVPLPLETEETLATESESSDKPAIAKAGRRSAKAIAETEAKIAKEERKADAKEADAAPDKPKVIQKSRPMIERRAKGYRNSAKLIDKTTEYSIKDALELAVKTSHVKFDATVEMHIRLGLDPRQAEQNLRDMVVLPSGTGKAVRVAVFADPDGVAIAKKAGAEVTGSEEFLQQLDKGKIDFDILVSTPMMMAKLGKYAKILGPKGLMPNPKSGTVTTDIAKAVTEAKAGRVEYRVDSTGIIHVGIGKVSFGTDKLLLNAQAIMSSVKSNKPSGLKANYFISSYITTSMGPSIKINTSES